jgi:hypothetical protein
MDDRHRDVALFRYSLIREAADPALSKAERGALVRALAARDHTGPGGERVRVARNATSRPTRSWPSWKACNYADNLTSSESRSPPSRRLSGIAGRDCRHSCVVGIGRPIPMSG